MTPSSALTRVAVVYRVPREGEVLLRGPVAWRYLGSRTSSSAMSLGGTARDIEGTQHLELTSHKEPYELQLLKMNAMWENLSFSTKNWGVEICLKLF